LPGQNGKVFLNYSCTPEREDEKLKTSSILLFSTMFLAVLLAGGTALAVTATAEAVVKPSKPNIILIMTDDQDYQSVKFMPRVQSNLVRKGTSFKNAFVSTPLCCPSRATFLRGQYEHNHGVITNFAPDGGYMKFHDSGLEVSTVATWLRNSGYQTVLIGKYLNEYSGRAVPPGWSSWMARQYRDANTSRGRAFVLNVNGKLVKYPYAKHHDTDVLGDKANSYIRRRAGDSQPFFMYLATKAPHEPASNATRHDRMFTEVRLPRPPNFNERDVSDKPGWVRWRKLLTSEQIRQVTFNYRKRLRSLQAVDELVGALVKSLKETRKLDNTYIVFTSDNGWHQGEHRLASGKGTPYEESIKVPFIVRGPGVPMGQRLDHMILNNDFAPTVADWAGVTAPPFVDGKSIRSLLRGNRPSPEEWRKQVLIEHLGRSGAPYIAVRTQTAKYVEYENGDKELYSLTDDPYELESRHETDPAMLADMQARLEGLKDCSGKTCRVMEAR
jgi:arylsulfatase A-like enzyme